MKLLKASISLIITGLVITACSSTTNLNEYGYETVTYPYYELPQALQDTILYRSIITDYSNSLNDLTIFLDPGHGGDERGARSRNGQIHEADINLSVALYLKKFLEEAGCNILMTRTTDETVSLEERSELANYSEADLFVSIHHNATDDSSNYWTNYTSTFYHAEPGYYDYEPYEHSLAKFIQRDLAYALRNPNSLASFDGTLSDFLINRNDGFAVLRETEIPAVLVECSFITNRLEEQRLNLDRFNKTEAWGIFNGIAKFYKQPIPSIAVDEQNSYLDDNSLQLVLKTSEGYASDSTRMRIYFNKRLIDFNFDNTTGSFIFSMENIANGEHDLKIIYASREDVYAEPFVRKIIIK